MPTTFSLDEAVEDSPAAVTPPQTFGLDEAVTEPAPKLTILPSSPLNLDVPPQGKIPEPTELPSLAGGVPPLPPEPTKFQQAETGISDFLGETAKDTAAVASDIVTAATLKKFGKDEAAFKPEWNIPAMITGDEKLPYQKTIDDITKSDPYKAIVAQTAEDIIGTAPQLLIGGVGLPKLALRVLSGVFTYLLFKNEKPIADALGDYYGKNPEDRDPKQGRDLWAKAIENTGFATLTGYGTAQPGIAKEIPTLKSYLTKEVVESYPPGQLKDVFVRVGNDVADAYAASNEGRPVAPQQSTPEEKNLYNFIASGVSDLPTAVKGGAKVTDTTPRLTRDWLNKYLGIETTPTRTLSVNEQPPASPTISQPVQQLANGEQNAPNQIIQQESASQELSRPETRQAVSPDTGQIRQGAGSVPDGSGSLESGTTPVAPPPSPPAVGGQVGVGGNEGPKFKMPDLPPESPRQQAEARDGLGVGSGSSAPNFVSDGYMKNWVANLDNVEPGLRAKYEAMTDAEKLGVRQRVSQHPNPKFMPPDERAAKFGEDWNKEAQGQGRQEPWQMTDETRAAKENEANDILENKTAGDKQVAREWMDALEEGSYAKAQEMRDFYKAKWAKEADEANARWEEFKKHGLGKYESDALVKQSIADARENGASPEFRAFFGGIDPAVAGTTPEKVSAFAKKLGMEWEPVPKPEGTIPAQPAVVPPVEVKPTVTANQILSRPQGTTSPEELASLPDSELQKLTEAAQKGQYPMTVDATKWAISNPQADIPQLESMRQVMLKRGTYASFSQWYADAIHTLQGDEVGKMNIATVTGKQSPQPEVEAKPAPVTESVATPTSAAKPPAPEQSVQGNQVEAKAYIDSIKKNPSKQAYAQAYLDWVNGGKQGAEPTPPETLKESFSKAVRLTVDESLAREAEPTPPPSPTGAKSAQVAIIPEGMSLNPVEHGFDSVEQFQSDFEKLSIKEDADTFAETKDEFLKRKHCRSLEGTPIKRAMRKKT